MYKISSPGQTLLQTEVTSNLKMNLLFTCQLDHRQKITKNAAIFAYDERD